MLSLLHAVSRSTRALIRQTHPITHSRLLIIIIIIIIIVDRQSATHSLISKTTDSTPSSFMLIANV